jgi:hypothetical protein
MSGREPGRILIVDDFDATQIRQHRAPVLVRISLGRVAVD